MEGPCLRDTSQQRDIRNPNPPHPRLEETITGTSLNLEFMMLNRCAIVSSERIHVALLFDYIVGWF